MKRVRMRLVLIWLSILALSLLNGCQDKTENEEVQQEPVPTVSWEKTDSLVQVKNEPIIFQPNEEIPIMSEGRVAGYLNINWVQRLGIADYHNQKAVSKGIDFSYTINMNVNFANSVEVGEALMVEVKPSLVRKNGKIIGSSCLVGWSGFSSVAQLYDKDESTNIEIGVQPEVKNVKNSLICLSISDSNGVQYDNIYLSYRYIKNASKGNSLVINHSKTVHSINGGVFTLGLNDIWYSKHLVEKKDEELTPFYDYEYTLTYNKAPTKSREVLLFDSNDNFALYSKMQCYLTSDVDDTRLYDSSPKVRRYKYSDTEDDELYVTMQFPNLSVGVQGTWISNRRVVGKSKASYVRFHYEFPAEAEARTLEEMENFDGRFVVFQEPVGTHILGSYYDSQEFLDSHSTGGW